MTITDTFDYKKRAMLATTTPLNATQLTEITGITIGGTEPEGSRRRFLFQVDDLFYKFENDAPVQVIIYPSVEDVLEKGNTAAELTRIRKIPEWCGKYIYPLIALESNADAGVYPTAKITIKGNNLADVVQDSQLTPVFRLNGRTISAVNL